MLDTLHFLRPWWLLALPLVSVGVWLVRRRVRAGVWATVIAPELRAHVLARGGDGHGRGSWLLALTAALAVLALAGPAWERAPQATWVSDSALVIVLDMSHSMNATDVNPSRLERAKLKIRDVLARAPAGQTALVVYTANAFTVTPLTTDTRNIELMLAALDTDVMPSQGSFPAVGLRRAAGLVRAAGLTQGDLLLVTDQADGRAGRDAAAEAAANGLRVSVLAVGTAEGAPIPQAGGGFLRDAAGQVVVPQMREEPMRRLAAAGHGRFARLTPDDADLDHLLAPVEARARGAGAAAGDLQALQWLDRGPWLALLLLPLALLAFRRGLLAPVLAAALILPPPADAMDWQALLTRPDQRALRALQRDDPETAARLFDDPQWRAAALYRAGQYEASARELDGLDSPAAQYNRGNALARAGQLEAAIRAYDAALAHAPDHEDAAYNRDLLRELLQQDDEPDAPGDGADGPPDEAATGPDGQPGTAQGDAAGDPDAADADEPQVAPDGTADDGSPSGPMAPPDAETLARLSEEEIEQAMEQWLRRVPDDPGGLLRRKFEQQYRRQGVDQDGNPTWPGDEEQPW